MARMKRPRARTSAHVGGVGGGVDRLSALPDDMLRLILRRLDTRSALSTAVLSRRWARLTREIPELAIMVSDVLPPRYHRSVDLRSRAARARGANHAGRFDAVIEGCERRAMRAFVDGVTGLVEADGHGDGDSRRRAKSLWLEFFPTDDLGCVDRLISAAVSEWGVEDLEVIVRPAQSKLQDGGGPAAAYTFPHHCLDGDLSRRMRRLTLGNCAPLPQLHAYEALTELALLDMPESTPMTAYQSVFTARSPLRVLHLVACRCRCTEERRLVIDAPESRIEQLVVDGCSFETIELRALPALDRLACLTNTVELQFGSVPRLTHVTLSFTDQTPRRHDELGYFLDGAPATVEGLIMSLAGPERWIKPKKLGTRLRGLRALLLELPPSWDVAWTRVLLVGAPSVEVMALHIRAADGEKKQQQQPGWEIDWQPSRFRHRRLRQVTVAGFGRTWRQIWFLRYLLRVCKPLQRVFLLKNWQVGEDGGLWGWKVVKEQECPWSEEEKEVVRRQMMYGRSWSKPHLHVVVD